MAEIPAGRDACSAADSAGYYERHRPDQTLLYQMIEQHYSVCVANYCLGCHGQLV